MVQTFDGAKAVIGSAAVIVREGGLVGLADRVATLICIDGCDPDGRLAAAVVNHLNAGGGVVIAADPRLQHAVVDSLPAPAPRLGTEHTWPDTGDPLVAARHGCATSGDRRVVMDGALTVSGGTPVVVSGSTTLAATSDVLAGRVAVMGDVDWLTDRLIGVGDNAAFLVDLVNIVASGARLPDAAVGALSNVFPTGACGGPWPPLTTVSLQAHVDALSEVVSDIASSAPSAHSDRFLDAAALAGARLPPAMRAGLARMRTSGPRPAAIRFRGLPLGEQPPTPTTPTDKVPKSLVTEAWLFVAARQLGEPVGYEPEHGGEPVQNIVPTERDRNRQKSTSSEVDLLFHTEMAFHLFRPRFLELLCIRPDPARVAGTLLASVPEAASALSLLDLSILREPRFQTSADESFVGRHVVDGVQMSNPIPVLDGPLDDPRVTFDLDLMRGTDGAARRALAALADAITACALAVVLDEGDLLVIDNDIAVHGRTHFTARFDGTDRWLQRTFVVTDLSRSSTDRDGRVITTRFRAA